MKTEINKTQTRRAFFSDLANRVVVFGFISPALHRLGFSFMDDQNTVLTTVKTADYPELQRVGGFVLFRDTPAGEVLIVRSGTEQFDAMSNVCPHKQCHVEVKSPTLIKCPCHGSTYGIDGTYIKGPSKKSLKKFRITVENGVIRVYEI